jgi:hypothetical protein
MPYAWSYWVQVCLQCNKKTVSSKNFKFSYLKSAKLNVRRKTANRIGTAIIYRLIRPHTHQRDGRSIWGLSDIITRGEEMELLSQTPAKSQPAYHNAKAVPLHATKALGGRGGIYPTHFRPRHYMGWVVSLTSGHALPPEKGPPVLIGQEAGWAPEPVWTQRLEENFFRLCRGSSLDRPIVQPVARLYTDWANPAYAYHKANMNFQGHTLQLLPQVENNAIK